MTDERKPTSGELADGMALWQEHRPQTIEDWKRIPARFNADLAVTEAERDAALKALKRIASLNASPYTSANPADSGLGFAREIARSVLASTEAKDG